MVKLISTYATDIKHINKKMCTCKLDAHSHMHDSYVYCAFLIITGYHMFSVLDVEQCKHGVKHLLCCIKIGRFEYMAVLVCVWLLFLHFVLIFSEHEGQKWWTCELFRVEWQRSLIISFKASPPLCLWAHV